MKPSELRISNWVYLFGDAVQLTKEHLIYLLQKDGTPDPIPLTEEWLLKFGFKRILQNEIDTFYDKNDDRVRLTLLFKQGNFFSATIDDNIKYVHQLQNLYFALTGKELKITSPAQTKSKN